MPGTPPRHAAERRQPQAAHTQRVAMVHATRGTWETLPVRPVDTEDGRGGHGHDQADSETRALSEEQRHPPLPPPQPQVGGQGDICHRRLFPKLDMRPRVSQGSSAPVGPTLIP